MAGLTIYIDDKDLVKAQKGNEVDLDESIKNIFDAEKFIIDYYSSEGFKNRVNKENEALNRHNRIGPEGYEKGYKEGHYLINPASIIPSDYTLHTADQNRNEYQSFNDNGKITIGIKNNPNANGTAHEIAHSSKFWNTPLVNDITKEDIRFSPHYNYDYRNTGSWKYILDPNNNAKSRHDRDLNESYSDLVETRYWLQKNGYFDNMNPDDVMTKKRMYDILEKNGVIFDENKKYKGYDKRANNIPFAVRRFLINHEPQQIIDAINLVADNNTNELLDKAQLGTQAKINVLDNVNEHKFRKIFDSDNKSWYTGFTGRRGENTNGEVYLANGMSNAEIRKEFPGALIKVENGVKTFRLPKVNEDVVLPKVESKWNTVVALPEPHLVRQERELLPEKTTYTKETQKYKYDEKAYRDMVAFDSPWTTPFWTMAMVSPEGKNYADRFHELSFYNANDINDITKIENEDFDFVNTDKLQTSDRIQGRNGLWIVDDNGSLRGIGYDNRGRIINQSDLEYDNSSGYWVDRPKTNKTTITTIDQNAVKRNKFIKEMNDANRLANMVNAGQNRTWNLQYQQGGPTMTLDEYLAKRAAEEQEQYFLQGSRNRTKPKRIIMKMNQSEIDDYIKDTNSSIDFYQLRNKEIIEKIANETGVNKDKIQYALDNYDDYYLKIPEYFRNKYSLNIEDYNRNKKYLNYFKSILKYNDFTEELPNCIATATSNHPYNGHYVTGNQTFFANPGKYGWKEVIRSEIKPGGLIQLGKVPNHAVILDMVDNNGNMFVNYSNGMDKYQKNKPLTEDYFDMDMSNNRYYNFVGNSADSARWIDEYNNSNQLIENSNNRKLGGHTGLTIFIDDEQFKKGGQIHIKEKNKNKFTKQAQSAGMSVQEFARHVLAHKDRYPASTVKRANFARNASKWSK